MPRTQYKVYQKRRKKQHVSLLLVLSAAVVIAFGFRSRQMAENALSAQPLSVPTPTAVAPLFDETPAEREYVLPASSWYALQTGLYSDSASAGEVAGLLTDRGAPGYVLAQNGKYRVLIAAYDDQAAADAMRTRLSQHQNVETIVYRWTGDEVTLRLSGMTGQLDAAEAGLTLLFQTAPAMRDLAVACDQGEYSADEVIAALDSTLSQLDTWEQTIHTCFYMPYPPLVNELLCVSDAVRDAVLSAQSASGITELSAMLKLQSMSLYERLNTFRSYMLGL